jgi:hypothetical protein
MITLLPSSAALNIANTAPVVHVRQNPARKPIETAQPRSRVALIEASSFLAAMERAHAGVVLYPDANDSKLRVDVAACGHQLGRMAPVNAREMEATVKRYYYQAYEQLK